ncbi:hypothetical protein CLU79DRAFT_685819, partial [Phycomyces nitens]
IATMNCRELVKTDNPNNRSLFIRYLRTMKLNILALQETCATSPSLQHTFH